MDPSTTPPREMPVLFLSLDYPPNDGGISRLSTGIVSALASRSIGCHVVTFQAGDKVGLPRPSAVYTEVSRRKGVRDFQILRAVRNHVRRYGRTAPIIATVWNPEATLAIMTGARRVSILTHGNEVMPYSRYGMRSCLRCHVLNRAHAVICNSSYTERLVQRITRSAHTAVLNPAIDCDSYRPQMSRESARQMLNLTKDAKVVITVARLDPIKGHVTVLRAISNLPPVQRSMIRYIIIGKGEMRESLEETARKLGIDGLVYFPGFVAEADLLAWYASADLFTLPSKVDPRRRGMEGFGMALTEAQAAGVPVIGSRSGGIPDAIKEGEGGWLIEEGDFNALGFHLERLFDAPEEFVEQGRRGADRVRREHNWDQYTKRLISII